MTRLVVNIARSGAAALALAIASVAAPAAFPERPITLVVPAAAGGQTDAIARIVAAHMAKTLGQAIVVENGAGGGGTIAATRVAHAAGDGYTIMMGTWARTAPPRLSTAISSTTRPRTFRRSASRP